MRTLDFLVIGAQKAGTTTLHLLLKQHPRLWLPAAKEVPFFTSPGRWSAGLDAFLSRTFAEAPSDRLLGKVTPHYMKGSPGIPTSEVAWRVAATIPQVRLVAVLRDPIDRAVSHWRMTVRRGQEHRSVDHTMIESLAPEALEDGRRDPGEINAYISQGEYGRILSAWLERFDRDQLHVELTSDLKLDQTRVASRVATFIGAGPHDFAPVGRVHQSGARTKVGEHDARELFDLLHTHVWPDAAAGTRFSFEFWFDKWNMIPDDDVPTLDAHVADRMRDHFAADAHRLAAMGIYVPWR